MKASVYSDSVTVHVNRLRVLSAQGTGVGVPCIGVSDLDVVNGSVALGDGWGRICRGVDRSLVVDIRQADGEGLVIGGAISAGGLDGQRA